jgi:nicotinamidase/pyrazinamidase
LGFETYLIEDACRGVELNEGDVRRSIEVLRESGVHIVDSQGVAPA